MVRGSPPDGDTSPTANLKGTFVGLPPQTSAPPSSPSGSPPSTPLVTTSTSQTEPELTKLTQEQSPEQTDEGQRSRHASCEDVGTSDEAGEGSEEVHLSIAAIERLEELLNRPRWVVPVLPKQELETLLETSIRLVKQGLHKENGDFIRFVEKGLTTSFQKLMADDAVKDWKAEIQRYIYKATDLFLQLVVRLISDPDAPYAIYDILALVFESRNKYHSHNGYRQGETPDFPYAKSPDNTNCPKGWLVDMINRFGSLGGFDRIKERFSATVEPPLNVTGLCTLLKPFGGCAQYLTEETLENFLLNGIEMGLEKVNSISTDDIKAETNKQADLNANVLIQLAISLRSLIVHIPQFRDQVEKVEFFRLKVTLIILQIASFAAKIQALDEISSILSASPVQLEYHWMLTKDRIIDWLKDQDFICLTLKDNLHLPAYVERLEKIVRQILRAKALSLSDLDQIWAAQSGKHDAIQRNLHELFAKCAWEFNSEQLEHLFERFKSSWRQADGRERSLLLELIRRLAEDDKEGQMADKALGLLWELARDPELPSETMEQALSSHVKILDSITLNRRDNLKEAWIKRCIDELVVESEWVVPAIKQMQHIFALFPEAPNNVATLHTRMRYRHDLISDVQSDFLLCARLSGSLATYMARVRAANVPAHTDGNLFCLDGRTTHSEHLYSRLQTLQFILRDGRLWLCSDQAVELWDTLVVNSVLSSDREVGFTTFSSLLRNEDFDPDTVTQFFQDKVLHLEPSLLTDTGLDCFDCFFKQVNVKENRLIEQRRSPPLLNSLELIGQEYMWRIILHAGDHVSTKAINLFKDYYSSPSHELLSRLGDLHSLIIDECFSRLRVCYDTLKLLGNDKDCLNKQSDSCIKMTRVLRVLTGYIRAYDEEFGIDRVRLPLYRAGLGRCFKVKVKIPVAGRNQLEERVDVLVHANQALSFLRKDIIDRFLSNQKGAAGTRVELFLGNRLLEQSMDDRKSLEELEITEHSNLQLKLGGAVTTGSSPDSSAESSPTHSPQHEQNTTEDLEALLPGTVLSKRHDMIEYLINIADLGSKQHRLLKDLAYARELLRVIPADEAMIDELSNACHTNSLISLFFGDSPARVLYYLELAHSQLLPAAHKITTQEFQETFFRANGLEVCLAMLTQNNFLHQADPETRNAANYWLLRLLKFHLYVSGRLLIGRAIDSKDMEEGISAQAKISNGVLRQIVEAVPGQHDVLFRQVCDQLSRSMRASTVPLFNCRTDHTHLEVLLKMAWAAGNGDANVNHLSTVDDIHKSYLDLHQIIMANQLTERLCHEALDVLVLAVALCPNSDANIMRADNTWKKFAVDIIFSPISFARSRAIDSLFIVITKVYMQSNAILQWSIDMLFEVLFTKVERYHSICMNYFHLLFRLLEFSRIQHKPVNHLKERLYAELEFLEKAKQHTVNNSESYPLDYLLDGHLTVTKELIEMLSIEEKLYYGCNQNGPNLVKTLLEDFLLPSSKVYVEQRQASSLQRSITMSANISASSQTASSYPINEPSMPRSATTCMAPSRCVPVCGSQMSTEGAYDVLIALCTGCLENLIMVAKALIEMFYADGCSLVTDWEYAPTVALRGPGGFVGLKNGGATCYMNSVFQQLFMVEQIRHTLVSAGNNSLELEDSDIEDSTALSSTTVLSTSTQSLDTEKNVSELYNVQILRCVQLMFANLLGSQLQFYVPRKFWKQFKFSGQSVNLREQQDALEFFNAVVDTIDEGLKAIKEPVVCTKTFGGMFADQKICKTCPHRYQREEPFTSLSVDVRSHSNLLDSLQEYVKGDLLESDNAYYCEKCDKKVAAIKRLCIDKLPPILAIQLKRFDFDWERETPMKFNDYFEFPRILDMEPYTVQGLASKEGEVIAPVTGGNERINDNVSSCYRLRGVIVHSGQANGGHYFSYILSSNGKWYKFDDGDVAECEMHNDEEMRNMCFGGEYPTEVFDHINKRYQSRRQKRWWNAYILFYDKIPQDDTISATTSQLEQMSLSTRLRQMPPQLEAIVRRKNTKFVHERNQYTPEYFHFIRSLSAVNLNHIKQMKNTKPKEASDLAVTSLRLLSQFLFTTGLHAKKALRGNATEWIHTLNALFQYGPECRLWFTNHILLEHPLRFSEYLLESTSAEVRSVFGKILLHLIQGSREDLVTDLKLRPPHGSYDGVTVADFIIDTLLGLPKNSAHEFGRHPNQYFTLFCALANGSIDDKMLLLEHDVLGAFIMLIMEEWSVFRSMFAEIGKCFQTIGLLLRSCSLPEDAVSKPTGNEFLSVKIPLKELSADIFTKIASSEKFCKAWLDQAIALDETKLVFQFLCWENMELSKMTIRLVVWQIFYAYDEVKLYINLLLLVLDIKDSWQRHRILYAFKGDSASESRGGIFQLLQEQSSRAARRCYIVMKTLTLYLDNQQVAFEILDNSKELKKAWLNQCNWLKHELEQSTYGTRSYPTTSSTYYYQTNISSNENHLLGSFLERTQSALDVCRKSRLLIENGDAQQDVDENMEEDDVNDESQQDYDCIGVGVRPDYPNDPPPAYSATIHHSHSEGSRISTEFDGVHQVQTETDLSKIDSPGDKETE